MIYLNISAIITEYNPLHKGHIYHINKTKELTNCDGLICIMSGNYVQRGIPAIIDKWRRTEIALKNGVDLVIELPVIYSLSSAEFFSFGAVSLLNSLGIVNNICFGSEYGNIDLLLKIAKILNEEPQEFKILLKEYLSQGLAYPSARSVALSNYLKKFNFEYVKIAEELNLDDILNSSNNILGIEYCKSLLKLSSHIKPYTIKREGSSYNEENLDENFSSATAIRKFLKENSSIQELEDHLPFSTYNHINNLKSKGYNFTFADSMLPYLKYKAMTLGKSIEGLPDVSEGIHNRILKYLSSGNNYQDIILEIKSKRYTYTRISRILCQYFIGFESYNTISMRNCPAPYARILGFNSKGRDILNKIKKTSSIPLITNVSKHINDYLSLDIQATRSYSLINSSIHQNSDYLTKPIIIK